MIVDDYHVHTSFSIDCNVPMEEQCRAAVAAGLRAIAFTEHVDHDACDRESRELYDYDAYLSEVERCRELFEGRLMIVRAAEIDWNRTIADEVLEFVEEHDYEFIIGSVHNLDHTYVGYAKPEHFGGARAMYERYYDEMESLVQTGFPTVVGHLDLPRRYHGISPFDIDRKYFEDRLRQIFRLAAKHGIGFEINTSGLNRGTGYPMPEPEVIRWFLDEGGEVLTIGSDSHRPEHVGGAIPEIHRQLLEIGIDWRTSFVGGKPERIRIEAPIAS